MIVANWDTGRQSFSPAPASLAGKNNVGVVEGSGDDKVCHIYHLLFAR